LRLRTEKIVVSGRAVLGHVILKIITISKLRGRGTSAGRIARYTSADGRASKIGFGKYI
jgi:hypothetical protein